MQIYTFQKLIMISLRMLNYILYEFSYPLFILYEVCIFLYNYFKYFSSIFVIIVKILVKIQMACTHLKMYIFFKERKKERKEIEKIKKTKRKEEKIINITYKYKIKSKIIKAYQLLLFHFKHNK